MRLKKCSRREALYKKILSDWDKLDLNSKALILLSYFFLIYLCINVFIDILSRNTISIFISSILSMIGFLLGNNKKSNKIEYLYREDTECKEEINEYNFYHGNIIQIMISISLVFISSVTIIFIDFTNKDFLFSFFRDLISLSIGFLLGEAKIEK
ncbi:hypothetical protein [Paraclostridium sordellii]|uniref:hypothetical protein n=1 Tax=Paraclostridium sordellii TaxID=1505 RepID=UPI0005E3D45D|nr:hypothetical protein [Paeniclostridium sordellii]CEN86362.1 Uncharacterised protein [[Clostridium] sordellii] [Paeniclostridium sordellii]